MDILTVVRRRFSNGFYMDTEFLEWIAGGYEV